MECMEFRRLCGGDPGNREAAYLSHRLACRACAAFVEEVISMDRLLQRAMAVELPAGMVDRIVADVTMRSAYRQRWVALAASMVIAVGAVVGVIRYDSGAVLADEVVEHLFHEPDLLIPVDSTVTQARLTAVVDRAGAELTGGVGDVSYAGLCYFRGRLVAHLVIRGEHGPVTILLLPDESVTVATPIDEAGYHGTILPLEHGSIAVIAEDGESTGAVEQRAVQVVRWQI